MLSYNATVVQMVVLLDPQLTSSFAGGSNHMTNFFKDDVVLLLYFYK